MKPSFMPARSVLESRWRVSSKDSLVQDFAAAHLRRSALLTIALVCACQNDGPHTFHTPAPVPARAPAPAPQPPATEVPLGANGPEARILAVVDSATGAPVTLTNLTAPFSVMTVVARGPGQWMPAAGARIHLALRVPPHTVLALPPPHPPPSTSAPP